MNAAATEGMSVMMLQLRTLSYSEYFLKLHNASATHYGAGVAD